MSDESAYNLFRRGEQFLKSNNAAQAAIVLERARRQEPDRSSIREALGRAYYNSGRYANAAAEFKSVIDAYPTNGYAHYCLGRCSEQLGDIMAVRRHMRLASLMGYE